MLHWAKVPVTLNPSLPLHAHPTSSGQFWQMFAAGPQDTTVPTDVCGCRVRVACVIVEQVRA